MSAGLFYAIFIFHADAPFHQRIGVVDMKKSALKAFARCRNGNFSVIFAFSLIPMIAIIGLSVDFGRTMRVKTALDAAADAAALSAVTQAAAVMQLKNASYDPTSNAISQGQSAGNAMFDADSGRFSSMNLQRQVTVAPATVNGSNTMVATVTYTAQPQTVFGNFLGVLGASHRVPVMNISGNAASSMVLKKYINIYVIVDVSQSMGIAGSTADMANLFKVTSNFRGSNYGCVFGCHVLENGQPNPSPSQTNETLAHANGISLRIDVIKSAISNMIAQAVSSEGQAGGPSVSIGLYTLEQNLTTLTTPVDATTNFTTLNNYTLSTTVNPQAIDLGSQTNGGGLADSYPAAVLSSLASSLSTNGKGDSPTAPSNYVFIMTDGTSDTTWSNAVASTCPNSYYNNSHCLSPYDATFTSAFSGKATVGIIYTTYLPLYNGNDPTKGYQGDYNNLIIPISSQIGPGLLAAATSSAWFIEASDPTSINTALANLFAKAALAGRLTQ